MSERELALICHVLSRHAEVTGAVLYGSRAKGTAVASSDVDLALEGIDDPVRAEGIASELEELPLPYVSMYRPLLPSAIVRCWST